MQLAPCGSLRKMQGQYVQIESLLSGLCSAKDSRGATAGVIEPTPWRERGYFTWIHQQCPTAPLASLT